MASVRELNCHTLYLPYFYNMVLSLCDTDCCHVYNKWRSSRFRYIWHCWGKILRESSTVFECEPSSYTLNGFAASFCGTSVLLMSCRSVAYGSGSRIRFPRAAKPAGQTPLAAACTCGHQICYWKSREHWSGLERNDPDISGCIVSSGDVNKTRKMSSLAVGGSGIHWALYIISVVCVFSCSGRDSLNVSVLQGRLNRKSWICMKYYADYPNCQLTELPQSSNASTKQTILLHFFKC
jgi:hypothetical protein